MALALFSSMITGFAIVLCLLWQVYNPHLALLKIGLSRRISGRTESGAWKFLNCSRSGILCLLLKLAVDLISGTGLIRLVNHAHPSQRGILPESMGPALPYYRLIWVHAASPKTLICALRALHNKLLTCDTLLSLGVISQNICALCSTNGESREHLFFICPFSSYIWSLCRLKLGLPAGSNGSLTEEANELQNTFKGKNRRTALTGLVFRAAIWHVWKERNSRIFLHLASHKVVVFRRLYEDVLRLLKFCSWPGNPMDPILNNWSWSSFFAFSFVARTCIYDTVYVGDSFGSIFAPYLAYYSRRWWLLFFPLSIARYD